MDADNLTTIITSGIAAVATWLAARAAVQGRDSKAKSAAVVETVTTAGNDTMGAIQLQLQDLLRRVMLIEDRMDGGES